MIAWFTSLLRITVLDARLPLTRYVGRAALFSLVPGLGVLAGVGLLFPDAVIRPAPGGSALAQALSALFIAPPVETLLMWPILSGLRRAGVQAKGQVAGTALAWSSLHALISPLWGVVVLWPFAVFSAVFVVQRRVSTGRALAVTAMVHAAHNTLPAILMLAAG